MRSDLLLLCAIFMLVVFFHSHTFWIYGFVSIFVQKDQTFHCSFSFEIRHFVDADWFKNNSIMGLLHFCMRVSNNFFYNFFMPCFKLYVFRELQDFMLYIPAKSLLMWNIIIAIICSDSWLRSYVCSAVTCKCFHICGGTLNLLIQLLHWLSYSSPSLSSSSS